MKLIIENLKVTRRYTFITLNVYSNTLKSFIFRQTNCRPGKHNVRFWSMVWWPGKYFLNYNPMTLHSVSVPCYIMWVALFYWRQNDHLDG